MTDTERLADIASLYTHGNIPPGANGHVSYLLARIREQGAEVERLQGEINAVDQVLAHRAAIDGIPHRVDKIIHALNTAAKAEPRR